MFKYVRKPWHGLPQKEEEYNKIESERLFEDISSFQDFTRNFDGTILGQRNAEKNSVEQKKEVLKQAYKDPFDMLFETVMEKEKNLHDHYVGLQNLKQHSSYLYETAGSEAHQNQPLNYEENVKDIMARVDLEVIAEEDGK